MASEHVAATHLPIGAGASPPGSSEGDRLRELLTAAEAIAAATDFDGAFQAVADAARRLVGAHQAAASLTVGPHFAQEINAVSLSERYAAWRGYEADPDGSGIYRVVCETNRPLRLTQDELEAHPRFRGFGDHAGKHPPLRGWMAVPLVDPEDGSNLGLLQVSDRHEGDFTADDEQLLEHLARLTASMLTVKRLADERERERQRLATLLATVPCGVIITDEAGQHIYTNARAAQLLGRDAQEVAAHPVDDPTWDVVGPGGQPMPTDQRPPLLAAREGRLVQDVVLGIRRGDGSRGWYLVSSAPSTGERGEVTGAVTAFADITRSRDASARLEQSEARLRESQRVARIGSWEIDVATGRVWCSEIVTDLVGRPLSELEDQRSVMRTVRPEDRAEVDAAYRRTLETGEPLALTQPIVRPDGEVRYLEARGERHVDAQGRLIVTGTLRDTTDERLLQEQLVHAQRMDGLGRLAAGMAHDLNNWLTVVLGHAELLAEQQVGDPNVAAIRTAGERAAELTKQVLAFARRTVLEPQVVDVTSTIEELEPIVRRLLPEGITLAVEMAEDLPHVEVDPARLEQALLNLVNNARDAMGDEGRLTIRVRAVDLDDTALPDHEREEPITPGRYVTITVADTGPGMDAETRRRAFEPFYTTKPTGVGTGLGLSIVYGIVSQSGGLLTLTSEVGAGTQATINLPAAEGDEPSGRRQPHQGRTRGSETVLVVEDEAQIRRLLANVLAGAGYQVLTAPDGDEALEVATQAAGGVDLMVSDVVMPGTRGEDVAKHLRDHDPSLPVIYMSGYTDHAVGTDEREMFVAKPFRPTELLAAVRDLLDRREVPS